MKTRIFLITGILAFVATLAFAAQPKKGPAPKVEGPRERAVALAEKGDTAGISGLINELLSTRGNESLVGTILQAVMNKANDKKAENPTLASGLASFVLRTLAEKPAVVTANPSAVVQMANTAGSIAGTAGADVKGISSSMTALQTTVRTAAPAIVNSIGGALASLPAPPAPAGQLGFSPSTPVDTGLTVSASGSR